LIALFALSEPVLMFAFGAMLKKLPEAVYINPPKTVSISVAEQEAIMA